VTRDDPTTGNRIEHWTLEITNTSTDTWKDFHVSLAWKASPFGGVFVGGQRMYPVAGSDLPPGEGPSSSVDNLPEE
jgi:hypothetical protein